MADGSGGSSCATLAEDEGSGAKVRYDPAESPWRLGEGPPPEDSGRALFSADVGPGESSCLRLRLNEDQLLLAAKFGYTVAAGNSTGALTIALERDGDTDGEEILRQSGVVPWTSRTYTVDPSQSRVVGISICYEKASGGGDAGLNWAGVDNIRLETVSSLTDFCDLVMEDGSGGSSCAALVEDEGSGARVGYVPAQSPWRLGDGPTEDFGQALFSAAVGSGERSCLRLRLNEDRWLLAANFWYTVPAGTSSSALTISLERDDGIDEEILRASGAVAWTSMEHTVVLRQSPVVGISICYEKGSGTEVALDRAGVDNIRLETVSSLTDFCALVMADGSGGSSCATLAEDEGSGARVSYEPARSPWRLGAGPPDEDFGPALFSAAVGSGESSCLRLRLGEGRQLVETNFWYTVDAGTSSDALTISLERDGVEAEDILRASGEAAWTSSKHTVDLSLSRVVGISICYEKGSAGAAGGDAGLDWAGVDNIRLVTVDPLGEFCDLVVEDGRGGAQLCDAG